MGSYYLFTLSCDGTDRQMEYVFRHIHENRLYWGDTLDEVVRDLSGKEPTKFGWVAMNKLLREVSSLFPDRYFRLHQEPAYEGRGDPPMTLTYQNGRFESFLEVGSNYNEWMLVDEWVWEYHINGERVAEVREPMKGYFVVDGWIGESFDNLVDAMRAARGRVGRTQPRCACGLPQR